MEKINISVIIPCYNGEKYVKRAINSVLAQTCQNFEVIVVNDGSTDNSAEVLKTVTDPRVKIITQKNAGLSVARNAGIQNAAYPFVIFLDHDDEFLPDYLETVSALISKFPEAAMFATAYKVQKENKSFIPKYTALAKFPWEGIVQSYFKCALNYHPLLPSSSVIRKEIFQETGFYKPGMKNGQDMEFWVRANAKYKVAFTSKPCVIYHRDAGITASSKKHKNLDMSLIETLRRIIKQKAYLPEDEGYIQEFLNKRLIDMAERYFLIKGYENARAMLKEAKTKVFAFEKFKLSLKLAFFGLLK